MGNLNVTKKMNFNILLPVVSFQWQLSDWGKNKSRVARLCLKFKWRFWGNTCPTTQLVKHTKKTKLYKKDSKATTNNKHFKIIFFPISDISVPSPGFIIVLSSHQGNLVRLLIMCQRHTSDLIITGELTFIGLLQNFPLR